MTQPTTLKELSIADLFAMHFNYYHVKYNRQGARFQMITDAQFDLIETEIEKRINNIKEFQDGK
jgi:hypothetical protein